MKYIVLSLALVLLSTQGAQSSRQRITGCESVSSQCPAVNPEVPLHLANPIDCGSFCKCDHGNAVYFKCPDGLHFNVAKQQCDWPELANCHLAPPPGTGCDAVDCPAENGEFVLHLPNPDSCTSFCTCNWGEAIYMECPDGLHFNPILMVCDWPENAGCEAGNPEDPPVDPPNDDCGTIKCPPTGYSPYLPDPFDCNKYCVCDNGNAISMSCPPGLHFNPQLQVCDWPQNAGCDGEVHPPAPTEPPTPTDGCYKVDCPAENGEFALLLPNPDDCGSYCVCDWGKPIYMECPDGLHFNPILNVCDWPENANCVNSGGNGCEFVTCPPENGEYALHLPNPGDCGSFCKCDWGEAIYFDCPDGLHFNAELQVCDWPENANCVEVPPPTKPPTEPPTVIPPPNNGCYKVDCPAENGEHALHLPNPDDCGSYCVCDWGTPIYMECPEGLHFNAQLQVCDWPENANCNSAGSNGCELVECPAENGEFALHLPNPIDCGSFCKCDWGNAIYFKCPDGLQFNSQLQVCVWPENSDCGNNGGPNPTVPAPPPNGCANVDCPAENGEFALHLPNPEDCGSFCKCDWGTAYYFECPDGLHFNAVLQVCDWPENAGCNINTGNGCELVTSCPAENGEYALHLPNPNDCGSFCKCDWGKAYYFACPPGLHFNAQLQVCDYPENANCVTSSRRI